MSKYFGKTWWGRQWLNSLAHIDYSNRLPRGSTYARNGSITSITMEGNTIKAKVKGSRPKPYNVTIIVPPFQEAQIKKLIKAIAAKPVIISKLLNRELDPEILTIAAQNGLNVFPNEWSDFQMECSCPDWAVPCKHLAAVIYKVSVEIDNNPFLVFQLHKVDLPAELKKENIHIEQAHQTAIPYLKELLLPDSKDKRSTKKAHETNNESSYQPLNFSTLTPVAEPLIQLLPDAPVFYQNAGNFREKYATNLRRAIRSAEKIITGKAALELYFSDYRWRGRTAKKEDPASFINHHTNLNILLNANNEYSFLVNGKKEPVSLYQLITALWQLSPAQVQDYQPSIAALRSILSLALNAAASGAVVPQIIRLENKLYDIRWLPALVSKEVKVLVEKLQQILPQGLLQFNEQEAITDNAAVHLLSLFLTTIIHELSENSSGDIFLDLFFSDNTYSFNGQGQEALAGGIQTWLQRYYLTQGAYTPSIVVSELENEKFGISISILNKEGLLQKPIPLADILTLKKYEKNRFEVLQSLSQLSSFVPGLDNYINTKGTEAIVMNTTQFAPFLMQAVPAIQLLDIPVLLPKSLQQILKPKASVRIKQKSKDTPGFMRLDMLLDFDWQVAIGDTLLSEESFKKLLNNAEGLIKYKSKYIYVTAEDLEKLHKHFTATKTMSHFDMLRAALSNDYFGAKVSLTDEVQQLIKHLTEQKEIPLPQDIQTQLRPYQLRGYSWMYRNTQIGFGSVIADDMGLGKTVQVITTLLKYKEDGLLEKEKALVIVPTGLLTNWQAELEKFAPSLNYKVHHGVSRKLDKDEEYDILLTTYGIARTDADKLKKRKWYALIIDEAQNIKNYDTAQSKAIKSIAAHTFIAMSGTPVENRLSELWSIMDFSNRGFLGSLTEFKKTFATPIQNQNNMEVANKLKIVTSPFLMRRLKSDKSIISDLPDKIEIDSFSYLTREQAGLYEKTLQKAMQAIEEVEGKDPQSLFERQGLVLQMILALKQICNHPTQFLKNNVMDASLSGKTELLFDKLDSIIESNEKALIFTQFTEMGNLLKHFIQERYGEAPLYYHGGCSIKQRKEMVETFQNNHADKIFILSLKAAGTGLNLTAANHVIHYDLWWNPAVEAQATDRAYRIGQKSNVMVHRFITKGTFEERINEMIQSKKNLANLTVATGESWMGNLSNKELKDIFHLAT